jgi:cyclic pyranopterin phosphate synthase
LSTEGRLYLCLFAGGGYDLRRLLRESGDDAPISDALDRIWRQRGDRYSELRSDATAGLRRIEMSYIGG